MKSNLNRQPEVASGDYAFQIAERIVQLGEDPDLNPATLLARSHSEYDEATSLRQMFEDLPKD